MPGRAYRTMPRSTASCAYPPVLAENLSFGLRTSATGYVNPSTGVVRYVHYGGFRGLPALRPPSARGRGRRRIQQDRHAVM